MTHSLQRAISEFEDGKKDSSEDLSELNSRMLSSVIISTKLNREDSAPGKDPHERLLEIMHSAPISALLDAARSLSQKESLSPEESLRQIVVSFRNIDLLWNQVLLQEGITRLSSQYH